MGFTHTEITAGVGAVQEIKGSPRAIDGADGWVNLEDSQQSPVPIIDGIPPDSFFQTDIPVGFLDIHGDTYDNFLLTGSWSQFALNRGQLATRGFSQNLSLQLTAPGSDLEFFKLNYNGQIFIPIWRQFTLRLRTDLGYGDGWGDTEELPFYENFFAGGFRSVRGYKANTLGPRSTPGDRYRIQTRPVYDENGNLVDYDYDRYYYITCAPVVNPETGVVTSCKGGDNEQIIVDPVYQNNDLDPFGGNVLVEGSAELLFPLPFIKDQRSIRSGIFVDFGNVFDMNCSSTQVVCSEPDLGELRYSVGFGVTWITGFGPITFSLAKPLNDEASDRTEIFQFSLGQGF